MCVCVVCVCGCMHACTNILTLVLLIVDNIFLLFLMPPLYLPPLYFPEWVASKFLPVHTLLILPSCTHVYNILKF